MKSLGDDVSRIEEFEGKSLSGQIASLEGLFKGSDKPSIVTLLSEKRIQSEVLDAAISVKEAAGQINVVIHAVGILLALPKILDEGEFVESLSLGAGNTGRLFDLETNRKIAEFKFVNWRGRSDTIRQNNIFKDFYYLAEYETQKEKVLYVIDTTFPLKFLNCGRSLASVMSKNNRLWTEFTEKYGNQFKVVRDYYRYRESTVRLIDIAEVHPQFKDRLKSSGSI